MIDPRRIKQWALPLLRALDAPYKSDFQHTCTLHIPKRWHLSRSIRERPDEDLEVAGRVDPAAIHGSSLQVEPVFRRFGYRQYLQNNPGRDLHSNVDRADNPDPGVAGDS